ncbi:magnesium transporter CorA family protein [Paenibacillus physcomitrellae]|uniref:Magnesium transport protein CorA n=1 Tax=Paenibacillus physcomitrellae TaxID=1619311 RepID=A0ABQ1GVA7_9BACL|nr:magnesium transporter CorA family protein [Paenibacillus physcomitrellae]GGA50522.1 magnesium transport protein CorA [Paenibacillus physcomitrellae]
MNEGLGGERIWPMEQGWTWTDLQIEDWDSQAIKRLVLSKPVTEEWITSIPAANTNYLSVRFAEDQEPLIFGAMSYSVKQEINSETECERFHFFVSRTELVTVNLDEHTRFVMNSRERLNLLAGCKWPIDGMFVLARTLLHYFHEGMDKFEINLRKVEETMRQRNEKNIMDRILNARFELLFWSNLFIPYLELITAAREAYLGELDHSVYFQRFYYRADRMETLFSHYEKEIDTLILIDDAVSAFRGNDIMKTLTLITAIFTPAMVIGAIWGMNFDYLPWIHSGTWGFTAIILIVLFCSGGLYAWMWMKGWTGDLLRVRRKNSNL